MRELRGHDETSSLAGRRNRGSKRMNTDFRSINPATEEWFGSYEPLAESGIEAVLERAQAGFRRWRVAAVADRVARLSAIASALRSRSDELARDIVAEMGKPLAEASAEIEKCARTCDFYAERAPEFLADETVRTSALDSYVAYRPLGVLLAIMPWNFPYWQCVRHLAPALVAGNAVILKPAENTPLCGLKLEEIVREAGVPDGVFQTLLARREHVPRAIADRRIAAVTLTGSGRAGAIVAAAAGASLKKTVLELGGSDPFVVLADADVDSAATAAVQSRFMNAGQTCVAAKRMIVVESIADEFIARLIERTARLRVGDPLLADTDMGPLARADLRDNLERQVEQSVRAGAHVALEGGRRHGPGWFFSPVVFTDVRFDMPVVAEETFGPVAVVLHARDTDHAVEMANDTVYGLGADLWTGDLERAQVLAASLEAGSVFINGKTLSDPPLPFGGVKQSGYGRELSSWGIREFTNVQAVSVGHPHGESGVPMRIASAQSVAGSSKV
jgi:succinate-semialdehyde dehydrogenase/glutarate-semialdehyde dehydrogenase